MPENFDGRVKFATQTLPRQTILEVDPDTGLQGGMVVKLNAGDVVFPSVVIHDSGQLIIGGGPNNRSGVLILLDNNGEPSLRAFQGKIEVGGDGRAGQIQVKKENGQVTIDLNGGTGDITLNGADCAEEFEIAEAYDIEAGTVLIIESGGILSPCREAYDKRVAGVVSGGNGVRPGIILDKNKNSNKRKPIALNGKVYCKVDARYAAIDVGDLLTTSPTIGHAMKAQEPLEAFGSVIGKALSSLSVGRGEIPVLVALQ